jgi:hypothetical protein
LAVVTLAAPDVQAQGLHPHGTTPTPSSATVAESDGVELALPDLITLPPFDLRIVRIPSTGRAILRFSNAIANIGEGPLELVGRRTRGVEAYRVTQRLYGTHDLVLAEPIIGRIRFHPDHDHYHLDEFARYELWSLTESGAIDELVAVSSKVSYCVMDTDPWTAPAAERRGYSSCHPWRQGLSPGWSDNYASHLAGQWLEITDLPSGIYFLRSIADPADQLRESDDFNNEGHLLFRMEGDALSPVDPMGVSWLRQEMSGK